MKVGVIWFEIYVIVFIGIRSGNILECKSMVHMVSVFLPAGCLS